MLKTVRAGLPALPEADSQRVCTAKVLLQLAETWPGPLDEPCRRILEALCGKVAVAKRVQRVYEPNFKNGIERAPLPAVWWSLLIAVLLSYGEGDEGMSEASLGLSLKSLNAGLRALDIAEEFDGVEHLPALRSWAVSIVEGLSCEACR